MILATCLHCDGIKFCSRQWLVRMMLLCCELKVSFIRGIMKTFLSCIVTVLRERELSKLSFFLLRCGLRALLTHNIYRRQEVYVHVMYSLYILMYGCMMTA